MSDDVTSKEDKFIKDVGLLFGFIAETGVKL